MAQTLTPEAAKIQAEARAGWAKNTTPVINNTPSPVAGFTMDQYNQLLSGGRAGTSGVIGGSTSGVLPTATAVKTTIQPAQSVTQLMSQVFNLTQQDKKMSDWVAKNVGNFGGLYKSGYTAQDIANEAYSQTRLGKSAFANDINKTSRAGQTEVGKGITVDVAKDAIQREKDTINNNPNYDQMTKVLLLNAVDAAWNSGQKILTDDDVKRIYQTSYESAISTLDPYYQRTSQRALEDVKNQMADLRDQAARFKDQESASYKQKLAQTKQSLRARGLTFSGTNQATLGNESALVNEGNLEGTLPNQRRMDYADEMAKIQQNARDYGTAGERLLGSAGVGNYGDIADPYAGGVRDYNAAGTRRLFDPNKSTSSAYIPTGDLDYERLANIEKRKWENMAKYAPSTLLKTQ